YIDKTGKWVIQPEFDRVRDFSEEGIAIVGKSIRYGIVDKKGNCIVPVKYRYISEFGTSGYALVKTGPQKYNYIKQDGNLLLNKDVFYALPFNGNTAVIRTSGISDLQLIDIYGKPVTREIYIYLSALDDRHYCYKTPYVCGIADLSGTILIKPENESIKYERSGLYRIENGNKLGYYDERKADWIWPMKW
ncbi:MAG: WG repeat-containing protein, partial [Bacteroidota bacterium]